MQTASDSSRLPSRRTNPRLSVVAAVQVSSSDKPGRCGVTRNASDRGMLIVTPSRFGVGEEVDVAVHLGDQLERRRARVVRVEENGRDSVETWRYSLAVELEGELPHDVLEDACARTRALRGE